ncbi:hypothetical protein [Psychrobium sp. 1_MG-2023]|uniref:hypothetical protein n=1 Tax=Psychrobium sp. 1_MG-2023 TaxID=3062624 RepID=UPI000C31EFC0|nr:hypothetical protein [Psychrobium sp. 1_MG-2023]MDP2562652.1 hypothetical protein [Psychrobium sp. 1_MG-2023]PKF53819.1 hypothetical protein CW748_17610 [Alteromonadales bacterium alter-6D02]
MRSKTIHLVFCLLLISIFSFSAFFGVIFGDTHPKKHIRADEFYSQPVLSQQNQPPESVNTSVHYALVANTQLFSTLIDNYHQHLTIDWRWRQQQTFAIKQQRLTHFSFVTIIQFAQRQRFNS